VFLGATGYIGSRVCKDLLARSYTVHAVVRTLAKADGLKDLENASTHLKIFEVADLVTGNYTCAFSGCHYVIHTATPLKFTAPDPENDIIRPAVEGTQNVLKTAKAVGVKRVVRSSCLYARFPIYTIC
jgi:nucleoside-diphosphate-sugar epimerase